MGFFQQHLPFKHIIHSSVAEETLAVLQLISGKSTEMRRANTYFRGYCVPSDEL
jgi:hypothetical protein